MSNDYRKGKVLIPQMYLSESEAKVVLTAIEKATQKTGVTNNRKQRMSILEISRFYNEKH
ncbi:MULTISPECIES: hypothetical protein [Vibrio]|uniref:Uncharacterized protein n=1 Tax=Vibrio sp. FF_307 TaxID=1652834 RepID=A0A0H3ZKX3_9VIBR|nr:MULTISPECIES: hypothetical protein [Vibrio]AKN36758.1 hypothetical protein [Vibrio sp. FF_307]TKF00235.1 hypothetical protein FCV44_04000 [Vibrio kanaloae]TKF17838.1 hypothetical protein FCV47_07425 [Vibrio kanaloae]